MKVRPFLILTLLLGYCYRIPAFQSPEINHFGDKATWENASANITAVTFAGLGGLTGAQYPDQSYSAGLTVSGVTFTAGVYGSPVPYLVVRTGSSNFMYGAPDSDLGCPPPQVPCGMPGQGITVTLPPGATSVGLDLGSFWPPMGVTVRFSNNITFSIPNAPLLQNFTLSDVFAGFTSSAPIDSFEIEAAGLPIIRNLWFGVTSGTPKPFISPAGIVPVYSISGTVQPGEWITIYGNNLATQSAVWKGDFPTSLGGTTVTIDGKAAYLWFVSSTQIKLQVPDDSLTGKVPVVVTTPAGMASSTVVLGSMAPSFDLLDGKHVAGIILRPDGSGMYGGGSYDVLGPTGNSLGYPTVAAKPGDLVELFGVGFGPTFPTVPAGMPFSGAIPTSNDARLIIAEPTAVVVDPSFCGLSSAGLYQINFEVPTNTPAGEFPLQATLGNAQTQSGIMIDIQ